MLLASHHLSVMVLTPWSLEENSNALRKAKLNKSKMLLGGFSAHVRNDAGVWKGMIGQHSDANLSDNGRLLLQLCCNNALCIIHTFFQHRTIHKNTSYRDLWDQRSLILTAELSTDCH